MRWEGRRQSENVEDRRRGGGVSRGIVGGGIGTLLLALVAMYFGVDPSIVMQGVQQVPQDSQPGGAPPAHDPMRDFISVVLADTEDVWRVLFQQSGKSYVEPRLVLFSGSVESACGYAQSAVGPFYCSGDQKVYIDLSFYQDLKDRFKAPGVFPRAYVIATEVGHTVKALLGFLRLVETEPALMGASPHLLACARKATRPRR